MITKELPLRKLLEITPDSSAAVDSVKHLKAFKVPRKSSDSEIKSFHIRKPPSLRRTRGLAGP